MEQSNSEKLLIEIGKLVIKIDEAEDDYQMEVAEYRELLQEHEVCGSQKPSPHYLKFTEENLSVLHRKLNSLIKEFRAIKN